MRLFVWFFQDQFLIPCSSMLLLCGQRSLYLSHLRRLQNSRKIINAILRTRSEEVTFVVSDLLFFAVRYKRKNPKLSILLVCSITIKLNSPQKICKPSGLIVNLFSDKRLCAHIYLISEFYNQQLSFHFDILTTPLSKIVRVHCLLLL